MPGACCRRINVTAYTRADTSPREYCLLIDRDDLFGQDKGAPIRSAGLHVLTTEVLATICHSPLTLKIKDAAALKVTEHRATCDTDHVVSIVYGNWRTCC
jgi:hypothetical protein